MHIPDIYIYIHILFFLPWIHLSLENIIPLEQGCKSAGKPQRIRKMASPSCCGLKSAARTSYVLPISSISYALTRDNYDVDY